jgi:hypothetical protein
MYLWDRMLNDRFHSKFYKIITSDPNCCKPSNTWVSVYLSNKYITPLIYISIHQKHPKINRQEFEELQNILQNVVITFDCRDRWRWALHESGEFTVKELTKMVEEKILDVDNNGGVATIWNKWIPIKVNIIVWRALKGRLPVREELDKRGIDLDTLCPSCGNMVEAGSHCLVMCNFAMSVWENNI